jgi:hypothetical protein
MRILVFFLLVGTVAQAQVDVSFLLTGNASAQLVGRFFLDEGRLPAGEPI